MKIAVLEPLGIDNEKLIKLFKEQLDDGIEIITYNDRKEDALRLVERSKNAQIVVLSNIKFTKKIMQQLPDLKYICVAFTGVDHLDLAYCQERGIKVSNCAGYSTSAVADLVFGLVINLYRNILKCDDATRKGGTKAGLMGPELEGKKFGVVGLGAIGSRVALIAQAFGCEVYAYTRTPKDIPNVKLVDLNTLLATCDIVSLHVPANEQTKGLINKEKLALMKKEAILINTARGAIVDSNALALALQNKQIAGAGIDVFENEPPLNSDHPLLTITNCLLTPHVGFASVQAMEKRAVIVVDNIVNYLNNNQKNIIL